MHLPHSVGDERSGVGHIEAAILDKLLPLIEINVNPLVCRFQQKRKSNHVLSFWQPDGTNWLIVISSIKAFFFCLNCSFHEHIGPCTLLFLQTLNFIRQRLNGGLQHLRLWDVSALLHENRLFDWAQELWGHQHIDLQDGRLGGASDAHVHLDLEQLTLEGLHEGGGADIGEGEHLLMELDLLDGVSDGDGEFLITEGCDADVESVELVQEAPLCRLHNSFILQNIQISHWFNIIFCSSSRSKKVALLIGYGHGILFFLFYQAIRSPLWPCLWTSFSDFRLVLHLFECLEYCLSAHDWR